MANDAGARYIMPVAVFIGGKAPAQPFAMMLQCLCSAAFLGHWTRENSSNISRMYRSMCTFTEYLCTFANKRK